MTENGRTVRQGRRQSDPLSPFLVTIFFPWTKYTEIEKLYQTKRLLLGWVCFEWMHSLYSNTATAFVDTIGKYRTLFLLDHSVV